MPVRVIGQPYDDDEPEDPEHVTVYIKPGPGYAVIPWGRYATAWIDDDDGGPQPGGLPTWTWPPPPPPDPDPPVDPPPPPEQIEDEIDIAVIDGGEGLINGDAKGTTDSPPGVTTGWIIPVNDDRDEENTSSTATEPVVPRLDNEENAGLGEPLKANHGRSGIRSPAVASTIASTIERGQD